MKKAFAILTVLLVLLMALAACGGPDVECPADEPIGCVVVAPEDPIRIGYALVLSGANETLGIDSQRGVEIAIDDRGKSSEHEIELVGEDSECAAEGGQKALTKLVSDPSLDRHHRHQLLQRRRAGLQDRLRRWHGVDLALQHRPVADQPGPDLEPRLSAQLPQ